jgi:hypothetical protein
MVQTIRLTDADLAPASDVERLIGTYLDDTHCDRVVRETTTVLKPDGTPLLVYIADALPRSLCRTAYGVLRQVRATSHNRGAIGGGAASVPSAAIGYMDRSRRIPYCRATAFTASHPGAFGRVQPFLAAMAGVFEGYAPAAYGRQQAFVDGLSPEYRIGQTPFTTATVNNTWRTAAHRDAGDFSDGLGVLSVLEGGRFGGGELIFPRFRTAVNLRTGAVLLADVHEIHGNAPLVGEPGTYERISVVAYARERMTECGSSVEEIAHAQRAFSRAPARRPRKRSATVPQAPVVGDVDPACPSCGSEICERSPSECLTEHYPTFADVADTLGPLTDIRAERLS